MFLALVNKEIKEFLDCKCKSEIDSLFLSKISKGLRLYPEWFSGILVTKLFTIFDRMSSEDDIMVGEVVYEIVYTFLLKNIEPERAHKIATYVAERCNRNLRFEIDFDYVQYIYREREW